MTNKIQELDNYLSELTYFDQYKTDKRKKVRFNIKICTDTTVGGAIYKEAIKIYVKNVCLGLPIDYRDHLNHLLNLIRIKFKKLYQRYDIYIEQRDADASVGHVMSLDIHAGHHDKSLKKNDFTMSRDGRIQDG